MAEHTADARHSSHLYLHLISPVSITTRVHTKQMKQCEFTGRCQGASMPRRNKLGVECHATTVTNGPLPHSGAKCWFHRIFSEVKPLYLLPHVSCAWSVYPLGNYTKKRLKIQNSQDFNLWRKKKKKSSICSGYLSFFLQPLENIWKTGIVFPFYFCIHVQAQQKTTSFYYEGGKKYQFLYKQAKE